MISFEYSYLLIMAFVLYGMHLFWTYFLIKLGLRSATGKNFKNIHDDATVKEKWLIYTINPFSLTIFLM